LISVPADAWASKKPPEGFSSPCDGKLERAKRLELSTQNSEVIEIKSDIESHDTGCSQIDAHADAEFAEIAAAWPGLSPEIRAAVLTLIKVAASKNPGHVAP
jgi:hypothetical protein